MEDPVAVEKSPEEMPATLNSRPQTGLSFLAPEPEDLEDLYSRYKKLQQELEFLEVQEEYIKDEQKNLKKEFLHAQEEVKRIQSIPLVIGQFLEAVDQNTAIVGSTTAAFIRVVGSEFVQKYLGEGPRMVRDVFRLAKENAPAIIFIDEIDAIATKRFDAQTGADREVQRILLELLNQMDGFDQNVNVKVIMATNRADTLDPALLRPGRLDRKIEFPLPDRRQKRLIFSTITSKMNLSEEVDLEDYVARPDKISGADINSICQEAGMLAVRENRYIVLAKDFEKAYKTVIKKDEQEHEFYK
ncbi:26S protease regulatory subunit 6B isoform 5 [Scophthalmus maximus]|uniref:26S protease regulatory subunit 6B isoform 5 n=1 Tax=Scophthalmus maximus TaxID=52904 RepID=A0A2U9AX40_SCOMX|nr:26S protease regulatory subunit 6B isoform 5 [Scophthalmus maximus]